MALPPEHPLWSSLLVIAIVAVASGALVYSRAERIAHPAVLRSIDRKRMKRSGSVGCALASLLVGMAAAILYGWMLENLPGQAFAVFAALGVGSSVVLSLLAIRLRRGRGLGGTAELVALSLLWGCGFGFLIPIFAY